MRKTESEKMILRGQWDENKDRYNEARRRVTAALAAKRGKKPRTPEEEQARAEKERERKRKWNRKNKAKIDAANKAFTEFLRENPEAREAYNEGQRRRYHMRKYGVKPTEQAELAKLRERFEDLF